MGKSEKHARDWKTTTLQVIVDARNLYKHSVKIMGNPQVFNPSNDFMNSTLIRIQEEFLSVYMNAWEANRVNAVKDPSLAQRRLSLQTEAIDGCHRLLCLLELAKSQFHLNSRKFWYWMNLLCDLGMKLKAWKDSDAKRYDEVKQELKNNLDAQQDGCRLNASRPC